MLRPEGLLLTSVQLIQVIGDHWYAATPHKRHRPRSLSCPSGWTASPRASLPACAGGRGGTVDVSGAQVPPSHREPSEYLQVSEYFASWIGGVTETWTPHVCKRAFSCSPSQGRGVCGERDVGIPRLCCARQTPLPGSGCPAGLQGAPRTAGSRRGSARPLRGAAGCHTPERGCVAGGEVVSGWGLAPHFG